MSKTPLAISNGAFTAHAYRPALVHEESLQAESVSDTPVLEMLGVTLLNMCNIWCTYCYNAKNSEGAFERSSFLKDRDQISVAEVKRVIDDAIKLGLKDVQLSGGEPLIRYADVLELVRYCRERNVGVGIFTNGLLASPTRISAMKEAGLSWVRISLGGATYDVHSRERGGTVDQFDRLLEAIRNFVSHRIPTGLFCPMVRSSTPDELVATAERAGDLGVDYIVFDAYIPSGISEQDSAGLMDIEQHYECVAALLKARRRLRQKIKITFYYGAYEFVSPEWHEDEEVYACKNGQHRLSLDANGGIRPSLSNARVIGNIHEPEFDLAYLWRTNADLQQIRNPRPVEPCTFCARWDVCKGSDDSVTYNLRRGGEGPPPTCPVVREYEVLLTQGMDQRTASRQALRQNWRNVPAFNL